MTESQTTARTSTFICGSSGSKDLQLVPRIAATLHILNRFFVALSRGHAPTLSLEVGEDTLRAAERVVAICNNQKRMLLEVRHKYCKIRW